MTGFHHIKHIVMAVIGALCAVTSANAQATGSSTVPAGAPSGSYATSCTAIKWNAQTQTLSASCTATGGRNVTSTIIVPAGKTSAGVDIVNCIGRLVATISPAKCNPVTAGAPSGSYLTSCKDITFQTQLLSASCLNASKQYQTSTLVLMDQVAGAVTDIANCDGALSPTPLIPCAAGGSPGRTLLACSR